MGNPESVTIKIDGKAESVISAIDSVLARLQKMTTSTSRVGQSVNRLREVTTRVDKATKKAEGGFGDFAVALSKADAKNKQVAISAKKVATAHKEAGKASKKSAQDTEKSSARSARAVGKLVKAVGALALAYVSIRTSWSLFTQMLAKTSAGETLKTQLLAFLGTVEAVEERFAELVEFAKKTPFELMEIGKASKVLQTLTGGVLATGKGLRLVGNIAASTGERFEELAVHFGRIYTGLMHGKKIGRSMRRLQQLGIVSVELRDKLEALNESGQKGAGVWGVFEQSLSKFEGAMARLSLTWTGILSNLQDAWDTMLRAVGEPVIDALKPYLLDTIALVESLTSSGKAKAFGEGLAESIVIALEMLKSFLGIFTESIGDGGKFFFSAVGHGASLLLIKLKQGFDYGATALSDALTRVFAEQISGHKGITLSDEVKTRVREYETAEAKNSFQDLLDEVYAKSYNKMSKAREAIAGAGDAVVTKKQQPLIEAVRAMIPSVSSLTAIGGGGSTTNAPERSIALATQSLQEQKVSNRILNNLLERARNGITDPLTLELLA